MVRLEETHVVVWHEVVFQVRIGGQGADLMVDWL